MKKKITPTKIIRNKTNDDLEDFDFDFEETLSSSKSEDFDDFDFDNDEDKTEEVKDDFEDFDFDAEDDLKDFDFDSNESSKSEDMEDFDFDAEDEPKQVSKQQVEEDDEDFNLNDIFEDEESEDVQTKEETEFIQEFIKLGEEPVIHTTETELTINELLKDTPNTIIYGVDIDKFVKEIANKFKPNHIERTTHFNYASDQLPLVLNHLQEHKKLTINLAALNKLSSWSNPNLKEVVYLPEEELFDIELLKDNEIRIGKYTFKNIISIELYLFFILFCISKTKTNLINEKYENKKTDISFKTKDFLKRLNNKRRRLKINEKSRHIWQIVKEIPTLSHNQKAIKKLTNRTGDLGILALTSLLCDEGYLKREMKIAKNEKNKTTHYSFINYGNIESFNEGIDDKLNLPELEIQLQNLSVKHTETIKEKIITVENPEQSKRITNLLTHIEQLNHTITNNERELYEQAKLNEGSIRITEEDVKSIFEEQVDIDFNKLKQSRFLTADHVLDILFDTLDYDKAACLYLTLNKENQQKFIVMLMKEIGQQTEILTNFLNSDIIKYIDISQYDDALLSSRYNNRKWTNIDTVVYKFLTHNKVVCLDNSCWRSPIKNAIKEKEYWFVEAFIDGNLISDFKEILECAVEHFDNRIIKELSKIRQFNLLFLEKHEDLYKTVFCNNIPADYKEEHDKRIIFNEEMAKNTLLQIRGLRNEINEIKNQENTIVKIIREIKKPVENKTTEYRRNRKSNLGKILLLLSAASIFSFLIYFLFF